MSPSGVRIRTSVSAPTSSPAAPTIGWNQTGSAVSLSWARARRNRASALMRSWTATRIWSLNSASRLPPARLAAYIAVSAASTTLSASPPARALATPTLIEM